MRKTSPKALFILKRREDYNVNLQGFTNFTVATGMYNSVKFVVDMLKEIGINAKLVVVVDNNDIDREVTHYRPTHVFIEGFWVVPEKFDVLKHLHKQVKWIVRCHSELPFLAQEGVAMSWMFGYLKRGVAVSGNNSRIASEIAALARLVQPDAETPYLPNYYPVKGGLCYDPKPIDETLDVGCFGAVRPLKNHLLQAVAAIEFASLMGKKLRFHINSARIEMNGGNTLKNLRGLFTPLEPHFKLVEHPWMSHEEFCRLLRKMDVAMQVSFTETYNIVSADAVNMEVPIVVSKEVGWAYPVFADPTSVKSIVDTMALVLQKRKKYVEANKVFLCESSIRSIKEWTRYFEECCC